MEVGRDREDAVVGLVEVEGEVGARLAAGDPDRATLLVPHDALEERALAAEPVERAGDGAGVAARLVVVLLEGVELLDHREGDDHLMLGELEDRLRVVEKHVRVEHEVLAPDGAVAHRGIPCVRGYAEVGVRAVLVQHASPPVAGTAVGREPPRN